MEALTKFRFLVGSTSKAMYFSNQSFWNSISKPSSSWVGTSTLASKDLVKEIYFWKIGDGSQVTVGRMHGFLNIRPFKILQECRRKKPEVVNTIFPPEVVKLILAILLSETPQLDRIRWAHTNDRMYSIKRAHHIRIRSKIK